MIRIAVLIPCLNEALTIGKVIDDFHKSLPGCSIFVCDNGSIDQSAEVSRLRGATVLHEHQKGKGFVVSRMFRDTTLRSISLWMATILMIRESQDRW